MFHHFLGILIVVLQLDLDATDPVVHRPQLLELLFRHKYVVAVVFAHFRLEIIRDHKKSWSRRELGSHDGGDDDFIAALKYVNVFNRLISRDPFLAKARDSMAKDDAFGLFFFLRRRFGRRRLPRIDVDQMNGRNCGGIVELVPPQAFSAQLERRVQPVLRIL